MFSFKVKHERVYKCVVLGFEFYEVSTNKSHILIDRIMSDRPVAMPRNNLFILIMNDLKMYQIYIV